MVSNIKVFRHFLLFHNFRPTIYGNLGAASFGNLLKIKEVEYKPQTAANKKIMIEELAACLKMFSFILIIHENRIYTEINA